MALQIDLKPGEKCIVSGAVIRNYKNIRVQFAIENGTDVCVLRENSIMSTEEANTPCRNVYFAIQLMYIDAQNRESHFETYAALVKEITTAAPSLAEIIESIDECVSVGHYYKALRLTRNLIEAETELLEGAINGKHGM